MAASPQTSQPRNELFQKLKPCCVKVSQLAIKESENPATQRELLDQTRQILAILNQNTAVLDEKLAEYVFFPLYHIFRQLEQFSMMLVENGVRCLNLLISHGWKDKMQPKMAQQIFSLLAVIIDGVPGSTAQREVPEELTWECYRGFTALFDVLAQSFTAATALTDKDALPALGHGVAVILDGVSKGKTEGIQKEALASLSGLYGGLRNQEALANFLPGSISTLAKVLSTPDHYKRVVLVRCLSTTAVVITKILNDLQTRSIQTKAGTEESAETEKNELLSPAWLKATTAQVKLALSSIMKLRTHDAPEVRNALRSLCVKLLDECHNTLRESAPFLVETAMVLDDREIKSSFTETNLRDLINIYPELGEKAKSAVYNWMSSLPRVMQSNDQDAKRIALHNISKGIAMLQELQIESPTLDETVSSMLRDSIVALMGGLRSQDIVAGTELLSLEGEQSLVMTETEATYAPVILAHQSLREVRAEMLSLLSIMGSHSTPSNLASNMLEHIRSGRTNDQIAAFWICFELVKAAQASSADTDAFLDMSMTTAGGEDIEMVLQDLYSLSVDVLDAHSESEITNWRLEALALEVTSYTASRSGQSFRPELIDVLFPIVTILGSDHQELRQHAIASLNKIATSCGYETVSTLIIGNVDYMVNSVALRLNSLDISPTSTQVLTMMIKLTGPRLVPFLDDVVESIFAALENYHGYPLFVESLFTALKELVDQSVKSDTLLLEDQKTAIPHHKKKRPQLEGLDGLLSFLERRENRLKHEEEEARTKQASQGHPTTPWKDEEQQEQDQDSGDPPPEPDKPPNTVTYQLLLRITTLTQHYLTSPTPRLRRSLLELLSTASTALAPDEEAFLPLVNAVWPVVIERLYDPETFVAVEACQTLSALCTAAGDFMASRFETEWGDGLGKWCRKVKQQVLSSSTSQTRSSAYPRASSHSGGESKIMIPTADGGLVEAKSSKPQTSSQLGQHSSPVRLWEAVVRFLTTLVSHVRITDRMFDEILDLLGEVLEKRTEVREALELVNADAVWLARYVRGNIEPLPTPILEGVTFAPMKRMNQS